MIVLFSPVISLLLPEKLTNRTYYRLLYNLIAQEETVGCVTDEEKALKLFDYTVNHQFLQGIPEKAKPAESLFYGEAYCDYQARVLNALLGASGIKSRYAMLLDKDGVSPHTLNEVFLGGKWCVFDPAVNIIFRDEKGSMLSLEELNEALIRSDRKLAALKIFKPEDYETIVNWYFRVFPLLGLPKRSEPVISQAHIFDRMTDGYFRVFGRSFFNFFQSAYLKLKKGSLDKKDFQLFYRARNYHLSYRSDPALKNYNVLLKDYPESDFFQDALFFCGMLYFDKGNFAEAEKSFKRVLQDFPKWKEASSYYLGRTYEALGDNDRALAVYSGASMYKLSAEMLEKINSKQKDREEDEGVKLQ